MTKTLLALILVFTSLIATAQSGIGGGSYGNTSSPFFPSPTLTSGIVATNYFNDFYAGVDAGLSSIGSPVAASCGQAGTHSDINHPGTLRLVSGTGTAGTGASCPIGVNGQNQITSPQLTAWTWESIVWPEFLPGAQAGSYEVGLSQFVNNQPWTAGVGFQLSSLNANANNYYCHYGSTVVDTSVVATLGWTRLTMVQNGTNLLWYINGTQVCSVAVGSLPTNSMSLGWTAVTQTAATANALSVDYVLFQRQVTR